MTSPYERYFLPSKIPPVPTFPRPTFQISLCRPALWFCFHAAELWCIGLPAFWLCAQSFSHNCAWLAETPTLPPSARFHGARDTIPCQQFGQGLKMRGKQRIFSTTTNTTFSSLFFVTEVVVSIIASAKGKCESAGVCSYIRRSHMSQSHSIT